MQLEQWALTYGLIRRPEESDAAFKARIREAIMGNVEFNSGSKNPLKLAPNDRRFMKL